MQLPKQVQLDYDNACNAAIQHVENMARKILREHKHLDEFIMAMGIYSFTCKDSSKSINTHTDTYRNGFYFIDDTYAYFRSLNDFMCKWDSVLNISGESMRFTAYGLKLTDW